jgi:nucleoside-diphosphate-sugar epimerase
MSNSKRRIFITGATGLLGSHLLKLFSASGLHIVAGYHTKKECPPLLNVTWVPCHLADITLLEEQFTNIDTVFHCAAMVSFSPGEKEKIKVVNIEGTANVVNACLASGVRKLVYVSSVAALGRIRPGELINETMKWTPGTSNSFYGETKFKAENEVWRGMAEGLKVLIVNPSIILGGGDWSKGSSAIFKSVYQEFPWYTEGITGFVDVADVARAIVALDNNGVEAERFILSADNLSYREVFNLIAICFSVRLPRKKVTPIIAGIVWRWEWVKSFLTGSKPLITKETAATSLAVSRFDNRKINQFLPDFSYTPIQESIRRICDEFLQKYPASSVNG